MSFFQDQSCDMMILTGHSGFCECRKTTYLRHQNLRTLSVTETVGHVDVVKAALSWCDHPPLRCHERCAEMLQSL
jgi:hypothetical protein